MNKKHILYSKDLKPCNNWRAAQTKDGKDEIGSVCFNCGYIKNKHKTPKSNKRILSVSIKRMIDDSPDTSWLGEYSSKCKSQFTIDRAHSEDCQSVSLTREQGKDWLDRITVRIEEAYKDDYHNDEYKDSIDTINECNEVIDSCDCGEHGDMGRNEFRYFNPSFNYITKTDDPADGLTVEEVRKYVRQDYDRMESLNAGNWCFIGIRAEAEIGIGDFSQFPKKWNCTTQRISSGCLWGIESDSDKSYLESVEKDELADLRKQLQAIGFSSRAISAAFKNVERKDN